MFSCGNWLCVETPSICLLFLPTEICGNLWSYNYCLVIWSISILSFTVGPKRFPFSEIFRILLFYRLWWLPITTCFVFHCLSSISLETMFTSLKSLITCIRSSKLFPFSYFKNVNSSTRLKICHKCSSHFPSYSTRVCEKTITKDQASRAF